MVDKAATVSRSRVGQRIGRLDPETILTVRDVLARFLGLGWFEMPQSR
jgi:mRNA-degrading endonuclease toxin of MazEF toxin-antitoxin module